MSAPSSGQWLQSDFAEFHPDPTRLENSSEHSLVSVRRESVIAFYQVGKVTRIVQASSSIFVLESYEEVRAKIAGDRRGDTSP